MFKCTIEVKNQTGNTIDTICAEASTSENAKKEACQKCQKQYNTSCVYCDLLITDPNGDYVDSDSFSISNGMLDM